MGSTKCFDTLIAQAKETVKTLKPNVEYPLEDPEFNAKIEEERNKYDAQAEDIYQSEISALEDKFNTSKTELKANKPVMIKEIAEERFNSTDAEKYGDANIKTSFQKEYELLVSTEDEYRKKIIEDNKRKVEKEGENAEAEQEKQIETQKKEAQATHENKNNQRKEQRANNPKDIDLISYASKVGIDTDNQINDAAATYDNMLNAYKKIIEGEAEEQGLGLGTEMVCAYNKSIRESARETYEKKQNAIAKAEIAKNIAIQTAKLKLAAKIGL